MYTQKDSWSEERGKGQKGTVFYVSCLLAFQVSQHGGQDCYIRDRRAFGISSQVESESPYCESRVSAVKTNPTHLIREAFKQATKYIPPTAVVSHRVPGVTPGLSTGVATLQISSTINSWTRRGVVCAKHTK